MKTLLSLAISALCLSSFGCTDAEAPPPRMTMYISPSGGRCGIDMSTITTIPKNSAGVGHLTQLTSEEELKELPVIKDGSEGAKVSCKLAQSAPGTEEINISIEYNGFSFIIQGATVGSVGTNGYVLFEGPVTGGDSYESMMCTLNTYEVAEGGGEGRIKYSCTQFAASNTPDRVCTADGWVYATDCSN